MFGCFGEKLRDECASGGYAKTQKYEDPCYDPTSQILRPIKMNFPLTDKMEDEKSCCNMEDGAAYTRYTIESRSVIECVV